MSTSATSIPVSELEPITPQYKEMMEKSTTQDFQSIIDSGCFQQVGLDNDSDPVYLILSNALPFGHEGLNKLLMYICKEIEKQVTGNRYTIIYSHFGLQNESTPDKSWLLSVYQMLPRNYKKNLKHFYIIHPSTWLKVIFLAVSPFLSEKVWSNKVVYLDYLQEIPDTLDRQLIKSKLPQIVVDHDIQLLSEPEVAEKVMTSMETLGRELLSSFANPFNAFAGVDPANWSDQDHK